MNPGDLETTSVLEPWPVDERTLFEPAEPATHDDEFIAQQQRIDRLNEYYNDVVAELRALLDEL